MAGEIDLGIAGIGDAAAVGRGGNAVVYRAREVDHDRWVAVKVLRGLGDEAVLRRFDRERRAMGRLSEHSGIVSIYSSGITQNGEPYLVMPLLPGSLEDELDENGPKGWSDAAALMETVARTVHEAHEANVIHRDLKPANILLTSGGAPLVADFGIAGFTDTTASVAITLTPSYCPPEVLSGASPSKAADVYALGATLFALISGSAPFVSRGDESMFSVMQRINDQPVDDLRSIGVPDPICIVIERAMHKSPDDRFSTAADFADELKQAVGEASGGAERERHAIAASTTVVRPVPEPTLPDNPPQPSQSRRRTWAIAVGVVALLVGAAVVWTTRSSPGSGVAEPVATNAVEEPAPTTVVEEPAATTVVEESAATTAVEEPAATTVAEEPTPTTVAEEPVQPVGTNGLIWVPNAGDGSMSVIDPVTLTVVDTVNTGSGPDTPLEVDGNIWVPNIVGGSMSVIDATTLAVVDTIRLPLAPITPIETNGLIWIPTSGTLSVIDPATLTVVDTINTGFIRDSPIEVNGLIWVSTSVGGDSSMSVIDPATFAVVNTIDITGGGMPVEANGLIWVADRFGSSVSVIDPATFSVVSTITTGTSPGTPIAANNLIWVPNTNNDSVSVIDPATLTVVNTITTGTNPGTPIAANNLIWVPNTNNDSVSVIDPATLTVVNTITTGTNPGTPIAANNLIWVPNTNNDSVSVIDPATLTVVNTITTGTNPGTPIEIVGLS